MKRLALRPYDDPRSNLLEFMPLGDPFPLSVGRTCDFLPASRLWQRGWDITVVITLRYRRLSLSHPELETVLWAQCREPPRWGSPGDEEQVLDTEDGALVESNSASTRGSSEPDSSLS